MTLTEWSKRHGQPIITSASGAINVPYKNASIYCRELWRLEDYMVSGVSAGTVWLVSKPEPTYEPMTSTSRCPHCGNLIIQVHGRRAGDTTKTLKWCECEQQMV